METLFLIGRILLGGFFLKNAYNHLFNTKNLAAYAQMKKVPMATLAVIVSGLLLLFGGLSVITGIQVQAGVAALVLFLVPITFTMHAYWKEEGQEKMHDDIQFWKNIAILGAVLTLLAIPTPWPLSL